MADETIEQLNKRYGGGGVEFVEGQGGLPLAVVKSPSATAQIYLHGAHLAGYEFAGQPPLLFVSSRSLFAPDQPIRGGVPIIFPWFAARNGADRSQMHGFLRTMRWNVCEVTRREDDVAIILTIQSTPATREIWNCDFAASYAVSVGSTLKMELAVRNLSSEAFTFENGLHTYFAVSDINDISVSGLRGHYYRDRSVSEEWQLDSADVITFARRTDRLYRDARGPCIIRDPGLKREIVIAKGDSATTVVWNPYQVREGEFADLDQEDCRRFVCVESCNARENAFTLQAGQTHSLRVMIGTRALDGK